MVSRKIADVTYTDSGLPNSIVIVDSMYRSVTVEEALKLYLYIS